jgi:N-methylhydantoinase A
MEQRYRLGIDIGGTFTDFVLIDHETGRQWAHKLLTTPVDPSRAVVQGSQELVSRAGLKPTDIGMIIHGTTLIANALIERKGARAGLLTTKGFEDLLDIRRESRYDMYNLEVKFPAPLVPPELRVGVPERTFADGTHQIDLAGLHAAIDDLLARKPEAVAICFLHSYLNNHNEQLALEALLARSNHLPVSLSSIVLPEIKEYERLSTTTANAYVQGLTEQYVQRLTADLATVGFTGAFYFMLSHGGLADVETGTALPVRLFDSGPAGGSMAGVFYSRMSGIKNMIVFDMGGTTAKTSLIENGVPTLVLEAEVAREDRFKKGSGLPLKVTTIDLLEIGAGGGSIARVDHLNLLKVGPDSAGAEPGPACYARGGILPTVTDADLVLGYLSPDSFLGGEMRLDVDQAMEAISRHIAKPLGLDRAHAAWGVHRIVNENMVRAAKVHLLERARDPRKYDLLCLGGAGPVHACRVAQSIKARGIISPRGAGVKSAMGFLVAPLRMDFVYYRIAALEKLTWEESEAILLRLEARGHQLLFRSGIRAEEMHFHRTLDMRYVGQGSEIQVPCRKPDGVGNMPDVMRTAFLEEYRRLFGRSEASVPIEVVNWRVDAMGPLPRLPATSPGEGRAEAEPKGERSVFFPERGGYISCPVYIREQLAPGFQSVGPAIVEERESTLVILPDLPFSVDAESSIRIELSEPLHSIKTGTATSPYQ